MRTSCLFLFEKLTNIGELTSLFSLARSTSIVWRLENITPNLLLDELSTVATVPSQE